MNSVLAYIVRSCLKGEKKVEIMTLLSTTVHNFYWKRITVSRSDWLRYRNS